MPMNQGKEWTFNTVADTYERIRPGYPEKLYRALFAYAPLDASRSAVEVGIGGGQAGKGTGSSCGDITISGATVTARAGSGATYSIGPGTSIDTASATCGNLYINGSISAYITDSPYTITP